MDRTGAYEPGRFDAQTLPDDPGYRRTLVRLLAAHALAERGTALGFARAEGLAPDAARQVHLAKTAREEREHARLVYECLAGLGVDEAAADRSMARAWRGPSFAAARTFAAGVDDWVDVLLAGFCLDTAGALMIGQGYAKSSYRPHAAAAEAIMRDEVGHDAFAREAFAARAAEEPAGLQAKVDRWIPMGIAFFGPPASPFTAACLRYGLKQEPNEALAERFQAIVRRRLTPLGLCVPAPTAAEPPS